VTDLPSPDTDHTSLLTSLHTLAAAGTTGGGQTVQRALLDVC